MRKYTNEDPEQQSFISITLIPMVTKADERTKSLRISQRKCKFEDETSSSSHFAEIYTQDLCIYECRIEMVKSACGCMPFFFIRKRGEIDYEDLQFEKFQCQSLSCLFSYFKGIKDNLCGPEGYMCILDHSGK